MDAEAWKECVLARMRNGPLALRAKGKTIQQIVSDVLPATGVADVALAAQWLRDDERFAVGDKPSRWVPAETASLVADALMRKQQKKVDKLARLMSADRFAVASSSSPSGAGRGGFAPRGGARHVRGGAAPRSTPRSTPRALSARIDVEDTTQTALRYMDRVQDDEDDTDEDEDREDDGATHAGVESGGEVLPEAAELCAAAPEVAETAAAPAAAGSREAVLESYFYAAPTASVAAGRGIDMSRCVLVDRPSTALLKEYALFGTLAPAMELGAAAPPQPPCPVFLNTHQPFCVVAVGVQGSGKSHTLACVLESVLLPGSAADEGVVKLAAPQNAVVLHYDQNVSSVCEATGLVHPHPALARALRRAGGGAPAALPRERMVVLVSPSYYLQRKAFYGDYCDVRPLLFRWSTLSADHIKRIMRIKPSDSQLYMAAMLDLLRRYQRRAQVPTFNAFIDEVQRVCNIKGQGGPLQQRIALLASLVAESTENEGLAAIGADLQSTCAPGTLVVVDLTDPLLASEEANGIFQVLTEQYRALPLRCGKLLALDEAHKFMDGAADADDGLSKAIVNVARLMRHDGMRLVVSTQSPKALAPELLELLTVAVLHQFHSRDWLTYLERKLPLGEAAWRTLMDLRPGQALVFASQHAVRAVPPPLGLGDNTFVLQVRPRLTADRGQSRLSTVA